MSFAISVVEQGLIYGILALGIYITYKILDFPDLTVDGSFPLGAAVTALLITKGVNPYLTLPITFLIGALAGICTGLIHVKCKVRDLLSGIIMMTALWTINLRIAGTSNVPLFSQKTIFKNDFIESVFPESFRAYRTLIVILILTLLAKFLLDLFLGTKSGYLLRAVGDNDTLVTSLAKDSGNVKIIGLDRGERHLIYLSLINQKGEIEMQKTLNLQDLFLNQLRKDKSVVTMFLMNGFQLHGIVRGFDGFTVILDSDGKQQLIYKHAISTVVPPKPLSLESCS